MRKTTNKTNYKVIYRYFARNSERRLTNYTDLFYTKDEAFTWYENFGQHLEKRFGRTLIFKESKLQISNLQII
jgi:hypothetical protein